MGGSEIEIDRHTIRRLETMEAERADNGRAWEDYISYLLEVDQEEMNQDGLAELTVVLARLSCAVDPDGGESKWIPPSAGGCWVCETGYGPSDDDMAFDTEFDTFVHPECLEEAGVESVLEYEREGIGKSDKLEGDLGG